MKGIRCWRSAAGEMVAFLNREMRVDGLFTSSLDADSEGEEGRFYVWSLDGIRAVLGEDADLFARHYDITAAGNWEGASIPNRLDDALADPETESILGDCRARLLAARELRVRPARDDKLLADWNGLTIAALATAGAALDRPDWVADASATFHRAPGGLS